MIWRAMALYIKTTLDEYEFPVAVAGSALELAMMLNTSTNVVYSCISKKRKGWYKVEEEDDEDIEAAQL